MHNSCGRRRVRLRFRAEDACVESRVNQSVTRQQNARARHAPPTVDMRLFTPPNNDDVAAVLVGENIVAGTTVGVMRADMEVCSATDEAVLFGLNVPSICVDISALE